MSTTPEDRPRFFTGPARSQATLDEAQLKADEFTVIDWQWLRERWVAPARKAGMERKSLDSASEEWFMWLHDVDRLAVTGVYLDDVEAVTDLLDFLVEPAARLGIELVIGGHPTPEQLDPASFVEEEFGYAYTLERLLWRLNGGRPTMSRGGEVPPTSFMADETQAQAIGAGEGVVQIIAPAGSGKTAVLVERVRELRRRGAHPKTITCVTFNKAAANELKERLKAAGVGDVSASTFHSLGHKVLRAAGRLDRDVNGKGPSQRQWRMLASVAKKEVGDDGRWLDPPEAKREISNLKLGSMITAQEYAQTITDQSDAIDRTRSALYTAYDELQRRDRWFDFDDLILESLRLLREEPSVRARWQSTYEYLLVDEYQDIEPAQELLVRIIAAPQDQLFCVGDEDQTLYSFRRARVERIICLDGTYPALERVALGVNYRCPTVVVDASRSLINHNKVRFPKEIRPAPCQDDDIEDERDAISLRPSKSKSDSAVAVAQALKASERGQIVVLARITDALRPVALACADLGVKIDGPKKLFEPQGVRQALQQHLCLAVRPFEADADLVERVCRVPMRSLPRGAASAVAQRLRAGESFEAAFAGVEPPKREGGTLLAPGELFTCLIECADAAEAIALLRGAGGFNRWFEDADGLGGPDEFECEVLEQAQRDAEGRSLDAYLKDLELQARKLKACRDPEHGIELSTIHGAKGRQWPHVIAFSCEEGILPHKRSAEVSPEDIKRGDGPEAERRLCYVAFTRAQRLLEIHYDAEHPSRFLTEAGLIAAPVQKTRTPRQAPPVPGLSPPQKDETSFRGFLKQLLSGD